MRREVSSFEFRVSSFAPSRAEGIRAPNSKLETRNSKLAPAFTLVECLLAGVILALFGAAMVMSVTRAMAANERGRTERMAAMYLDEVLTRIDAIGPATLAVQGPVEGAIGGNFRWSADIQQNAASDLYVVTVTLSWPTAGGERSVQGYTLLHDPVGSRPVQLMWEDLDG